MQIRKHEPLFVRCTGSLPVLSIVVLLAIQVCSRADDPPAQQAAAEEATPAVEESVDEPTKKLTTGSKIDPGQYPLVDRAATLMIWLVAACGLGGALLMTLIVVGARRIRRLTRSRVLQSKYDELEYLRLKHRREIAGMGDSDVTKVEP